MGTNRKLKLESAFCALTLGMALLSGCGGSSETSVKTQTVTKQGPAGSNPGLMPAVVPPVPLESHVLSCSPGAIEACNGRDDNCDGVIDEGCFLLSGLIFNLPIAPICVQGTQEICNGVDDNCNGTVDESCVTIAHPTCRQGAAEVCNGVDDNCNGVVDENCTPPVGLTCRQGAPEVCNGFDDNCNGVIDENCSTPKCTPGSRELCNGLDDNCNGTVDENCVLFR